MELRLLGKHAEVVGRDLESPKAVSLRTHSAVSPPVVVVLWHYFVNSMENAVFPGQKSILPGQYFLLSHFQPSYTNLLLSIIMILAPCCWLIPRTCRNSVDESESELASRRESVCSFLRVNGSCSQKRHVLKAPKNGMFGREIYLHRFITVPVAKPWSVGQDLDRSHNRFLGGSITGVQKSCTPQRDQGVIPLAFALSSATCASSDVTHLCSMGKDIFQKKRIFALFTCWWYL